MEPIRLQVHGGGGGGLVSSTPLVKRVTEKGLISSAVVGMFFHIDMSKLLDLDVDMHVDIIRVSKSNETLAEKL